MVNKESLANARVGIRISVLRIATMRHTNPERR